MKIFPLSADKLAISFSSLCAIHCLAVPLLIVLLPSMAALPLNQEAFHFWMVVAVVPTSIYALTLGCKKHKNMAIAIYGVIGLTILVAAAALGEDLLGEFAEKGLTLIGACMIAFAHLKNYRLCQQSSKCGCPEETSS